MHEAGTPPWATLNMVRPVVEMITIFVIYSHYCDIYFEYGPASIRHTINGK